MKFTAAAALLASVASASPLAARQAANTTGTFTLDLGFTNTPTLKGSLNANGNSFWAGKPTASYCPENVEGCTPVNTTSFAIDSSTGRLSLNAGVPGGQQVYVSPEGLLTYTVPHSGYIPEGSLTHFDVFPDGSFNKFSTFWLCSTDAEYTTYRIWLEYTDPKNGSIIIGGKNNESACSRVNINAVPYDGPSTWAFN